MTPRKVRESEAAKPKTPTFEASYRELAETVEKLEGGDLPLEESIMLYERGMLLAGQLEKTLEEADLRVRKLTPAGAEDDAPAEYDTDEE